MYIIPRVTKTYFYTTKTKNRFPSEFIQSKNEEKLNYTHTQCVKLFHVG